MDSRGDKTFKKKEKKIPGILKDCWSNKEEKNDEGYTKRDGRM